MAVDPQVRATQDVANELKKMNRILYAINANIVAVANGIDKNIPTVSTQPSPQLYLTPQNGDGNGTAQ